MMQADYERNQEQLELLRNIALVAQATREVQRQYFITRDKRWLKDSIGLEKRLDNLLSEYFGGIVLNLRQAIAAVETED